MKGFTFYMTYFDVAQELSKKDRGAFYDAVANYMFLDQDDEETLPKRARIAFKCIKPNLKTSKSRSESGQLGEGKAKSKSKAKAKQTKASSISISMSNSAQNKARKFDQPCVSGAEEAAADDGSTWEWDELLEELRA